MLHLSPASALLLFNGVVLTPAVSAKASQPNVLLIMCDDLIDYNGIYGGNPASKTPHLDRLTAESVRFTNAHTPAPLSGPARAALFSGLYPHTSQCYGTEYMSTIPAFTNGKMFTEALMDNGYNVMASGKLLHFHNVNNNKKYFSEWGLSGEYGPLAGKVENGKFVEGLHPDVPEVIAKIGALDGTFASMAQVPISEDSDGWYYGTTKLRYVNDDDRDLLRDEEIANWAADKLASTPISDEPFFLGVGFVKPHTSLVVPQKYFDRFPLDSIQLPKRVEGDTNDTYLHTVAGQSRGYQVYKAFEQVYGDDTYEVGVRRYLQAYLACVNFVDEQVGKVMDALRESEHADNTIVIFVSDHGYDFGQKDYIFKNCLWSTSTQIPFLVRMPDGENAGTTCDKPVSLIDLYPTMMDYCSLKGGNKKNNKGKDLSGTSLRELIEDPIREQWSGPGTVVTMFRANKKTDNTAPEIHNYSVRGERYRYISYHNGKEELYDCKIDPLEINNLASMSQHEALKLEMRAELEKYIPALKNRIYK